TVGLTAMVGLVVEEVQEKRGQLLLNVSRIARGAIAYGAIELSRAEAADIGLDPRVLGMPRLPERCEIVEQDRRQLSRLLAFPGESMHPDAIAEQKMIQRAVQRTKECATISAVLGIRDLRGGVIEPNICPCVVGCHHLELRFHCAD